MSPKEFPFPKQNMSTNTPSPPETYYKQPIQPAPITTHQPESQQTDIAHRSEPQQHPPLRNLSARRLPGQPSMRVQTQAQGSNVYVQEAPPATERRPIDSVHATPKKTLGHKRSSRQGSARERYRTTDSESEVEEQHNRRPRSRKPLPNIPRTESYPATDNALPPSPPTTTRTTPRRVSSGSASDSAGRGRAKPRGLNFHDARTYMKSGRTVRPESWHIGQPPATENIPVYIDIDNAPEPSTPKIKLSRGGRLPIPPMPSPASTGKLNNRIGWALFLNSSVKNHLVATLGELIGTTMFLFFAFAGTQVANINSPADQNLTTTGLATGWNVNKLLYVSFSFGFSLMVNVWIFFRISGALFNPAVTLALLLTGAIPFVRALFLFFAQIVGSIAASGLIVGLFPAPANVRTTLSEGLSIPRGLFIEAFLTAELVFTVLMLAKEKHKATFIAPVGIGLSLFIAELVGVYWTGGSLNPARSIGPCIVTWTWDKTHWIYWVGPLLGSLLAISFYAVIKALEYELANPGQDSDNIDSPSPEQNLQTRQQEVRRRLMEALGYDIVDHRGSGEYDLERLGYQKPVLSLYPRSGDGGRGRPYAAGGGNAPHFGPLGTTIRNSGETIQGDRMSLRDMEYESGTSDRKKGRRSN